MSTLVKAFKLISGEEIICRIQQEATEENGMLWMIERPMLLALVPHPQDQNQGMLMPVAPWIFLAPSDAILPLSPNLIVADIPVVPPHLEKQYLEMTSGIALA